MPNLSKKRTKTWFLLAPLAWAVACWADDAELADSGEAGGPDAGTTSTTSDPETTGDTEGGAASQGSGSGGSGEPPHYPEDDIDVWELRTHDFTPPAAETWYSCFSFSIEVDRLHHIIGFEPVVSHPIIHHYILSLGTQPRELDPNEPCWDWQARMIWGWAPGIEPMALPPEAGILVGDSPGGTANFVLQVHYNNPLLEEVEGLVDGIDIIVTPTLRPNDAFVLSQGDISAISIPPGEESFVHTARCTDDDTRVLLDNPIHVFASFLHAHEIGVGITSEVYRNGDLLTQIASQVPYDFNFQQFQPSDVLIRPGDVIETRCTYDSTQRTGETVGGVGSQDEMCINFMMYYPRIRAERCGSI